MTQPYIGYYFTGTSLSLWMEHVAVANSMNEMISLGDTDISLHIYIYMYSPKVKTQNTQSAKICLNLNFRGGGRGG